MTFKLGDLRGTKLFNEVAALTRASSVLVSLYELRLKKLKVESQKAIPIIYKNIMLDCGYRADLIIEEQVIIEIKSISAITSVHEAQLLSYLKLSGCKLGLIINFNVKYLKEGIRRMKS